MPPAVAMAIQPIDQSRELPVAADLSDESDDERRSSFDGVDRLGEGGDRVGVEVEVVEDPQPGEMRRCGRPRWRPGCSPGRHPRPRCTGRPSPPAADLSGHLGGQSRLARSRPARRSAPPARALGGLDARSPAASSARRRGRRAESSRPARSEAAPEARRHVARAPVTGGPAGPAPQAGLEHLYRMVETLELDRRRRLEGQVRLVRHGVDARLRSPGPGRRRPGSTVGRPC